MIFYAVAERKLRCIKSRNRIDYEVFSFIGIVPGLDSDIRYPTRFNGNNLFCEVRSFFSFIGIVSGSISDILHNSIEKLCTSKCVFFIRLIASPKPMYRKYNVRLYINMKTQRSLYFCREWYVVITPGGKISHPPRRISESTFSEAKEKGGIRNENDDLGNISTRNCHRGAACIAQCFHLPCCRTKNKIEFELRPRGVGILALSCSTHDTLNRDVAPIHNPALGSILTPLEPQSRCGDKPLKFQVVWPQNGTAVLKGLTVSSRNSGDCC